MGLPAVRLAGAGSHRDRAGVRRRGPAHQGKPQRAGGHGRLQQPLLPPRSLRRRGDRYVRGGAESSGERSPAARHQRLPEFRQPGEAGSHVAVPAGDRRHPRRVPRARGPGGERQRELLQRHRRAIDSADADHRHGRASRGRDPVPRSGLPARRRRDHSHRPDARGARRKRIPSDGARPRARRAAVDRPGVREAAADIRTRGGGGRRAPLGARRRRGRALRGPRRMLPHVSPIGSARASISSRGCGPTCCSSGRASRA